MKNKPKKYLTSLEYTLLIFGIRYAIGGGSIGRCYLPLEIITDWYDKISAGQARIIVRECKDWFEDHPEAYKEDTYKYWLKLWKVFDKEQHITILASDNNTYTVFELYGKYFSLGKTIQNPCIDCYIDKKDIKEIDNVKI